MTGTTCAWIFLSAVLISTSAGAVSDLRTRRIPNALTFGLAAFAVVAHTVCNSWIGGLACVAILAAAIALGSIVHASRLLGGGDVKLIAASIACIEPSDVVVFLLATALCGGIVGLIVATHQRRLASTLQTTAFLIAQRTTSLATGTRSVPYGVAIFGGAAVLVFMHILKGSRLPQ